MKSLISFVSKKTDSVTTWVCYKLPCGNYGVFEFLLGIVFNAKFKKNPCRYCSKYREDCLGFSDELVISLYDTLSKMYIEEVEK
jgi:hypothetical protein